MANPTNVTFTPSTTIISSAWTKGVNDWVYGAYGVLGSTYTAGAFRAALGASESGVNKTITKLNGLVKTITVEADSDHTTTTAAILGGILSCNFASISKNITLPTAAQMVAALPGVVVGTQIEFELNVIGGFGATIVPGAGMKDLYGGTSTISSGAYTVGRISLLFTNVSGGTEAIVYKRTQGNI